MSAYGTYIAGLLSADVTLAGVLTGGVHLFQDSGRQGINRIQIMQAFIKKTGRLNPIAVIYEMADVPTNEANDMRTGFSSTKTPFMLWIYNDGDKGFDAIETAYRRMYQLLQGARVPNGFQALCKPAVKDKREPLLQDAAYYTFSFDVFGYRKFS